MPKSVTHVLGKSVTYVPGRTKKFFGECWIAAVISDIRTADRQKAGSTNRRRRFDRPQGDPEGVSAQRE
jgi:hypothetical protein